MLFRILWNLNNLLPEATRKGEYMINLILTAYKGISPNQIRTLITLHFLSKMKVIELISLKHLREGLKKSKILCQVIPIGVNVINFNLELIDGKVGVHSVRPNLTIKLLSLT